MTRIQEIRGSRLDGLMVLVDRALYTKYSFGFEAAKTGKTVDTTQLHNRASEQENALRIAIADLLRAYDEAVRDAERYHYLRSHAIHMADYAFSVDEEVEQAVDQAIRSLERN